MGETADDQIHEERIQCGKHHMGVLHETFHVETWDDSFGVPKVPAPNARARRPVISANA